MSFLLRHVLLSITFVLAGFQQIKAQPAPFSPSKYVSQQVWEQVKPFLIPDDHPIKPTLDQIFSASRAILDQQSMIAAGFDPAEPQHHTQIIVTRHPLVKGYVFKMYLDEQKYHKNQPEHYFWILRATGAQLVQESIQKHHYEHLFKVPRKWIYLLPDEPSPPSHYLRKFFILVEDDMELFSNKKNEKLWGGPWVTKELLKALYTVVTELELFDCAKPANCSFSIDGKAAFVDTQSFYRGHVRYEKLTPFLSPSMQKYWRALIKNKGHVNR